MTRSEFRAWLNSVVVTHPFTLADARDLYTLVKSVVPNAFVDVYTTKGDVVHVRVDGELMRDLPIV